MQDYAARTHAILQRHGWKKIFEWIQGTAGVPSDSKMCCFLFGPKPQHQVFVTPPKLNSSPPKKWWLEDYFPIGKVTFQGLCSTLGEYILSFVVVGHVYIGQCFGFFEAGGLPQRITSSTLQTKNWL